MTPPSKTQIQKLVRKHVWLPEDDLAALQALADKGRRPLSAEIRKALEEYIAREAA